ncbi:hypothetical protein IL54_1283 [Sphingobium sp. ba1]|jgi:hypothetical protein|uniref:hypothetical protein n=1 Tax=Sphingobium sp. ba1 TaxID=1522072 RepID=UPI000502F237|nr:hypothetical protein [Sphingobium sp. ba1]KFL45872.1 hypothetical protein IL54_1283 [Sphingobium sp. ba1]
MSERDAIVEDAAAAIYETFYNDKWTEVCECSDTGDGFAADDFRKAARKVLATHAGEVERLREALRRIEKHYGSNAEGETETMRQIARQALGGQPMNMIELVARALARRNFPVGSDADIDAMWEGWADDAIAAIQAMRDPTPEMIEAGEAVDGTVTALPIWQAMIDAATVPGSGEG